MIVTGVNTASKHMKPGRRGKNQRAPLQQDKGGIVDIDMPIDASNVMFVHKGKKVRLGYERKRRQEGARRPCRRQQDRGDLDERPSCTPGRRRPGTPVTACQPPRLKQKYHDEVKAKLQEQLGLGNVMQVPTLEKIVINMGVGRATQQPSLLEAAVADLTLIAGQKPIVTKAEQVDRRLQAARGPVDRHQGHAPRRPHVGVPRSPARDRHPPHP